MNDFTYIKVIPIWAWEKPIQIEKKLMDVNSFTNSNKNIKEMIS